MPDEQRDDPPGSIRQFVEDYRKLRIAEGFASTDPRFARALPFRDVTGRNARFWRVRAFHYGVIRAVLALLPSSRRVLDLGAGNGWLARRLAAGGREVTALDADASDTGLGGLDDARVRRVRAELEALPLADGSFDVVVAAAALHYAVDLPRALAEIARVLRPAGVFVLADSPLYADALSRHRAWQRTRGHYDRAAVPHLARRYRGLTRAELDGAGLFHFVTLAPGASPVRRALDRLRGRDPGARLPVLAGWKR
jgi:SAM-dependent methyltransferase